MKLDSSQATLSSSTELPHSANSVDCGWQVKLEELGDRERGKQGSLHGVSDGAFTDRKKLPIRTKLLLGIGESVQGINAMICGYYLNTFLLETACLDPMYVGIMQAAAGAFDAINDPVIGLLSDRTRSRWGRRRPWLLFGAPLLAISYFGLWNALPASVPQFWMFVYVLLMYMGVSAGVTSIQVQIGALVPELTDDYDERTSVSGWRLGIANLLGLVAVLTHSQIVRVAPSEPQEGFRVSAAVFAVVLCSCAWVTFAGIRESFDAREESCESMRILEELRTVLTNKGFLCVSGAYLCGPTAVVLLQSNALMFCKYWLHDASIITRIMPCVQGTGLLMVPFWVWVTSRLDKRHAYVIGGSILVVAFGLLYFVTTEAAVLGLGVLAGSCLPVPYVLPYSMLPDVIDEDELQTGKRREGIFVGFFTIMLKMSITGALAITNIMLKIVGYEAPQLGCGHSQQSLDEGQPENVIHFIRFLCSFLPAMFFAVAVVLAWLFPITRKQQATIAKLTAQARLERSSHSSGKLSGNTLHSPRDVQAAGGRLGCDEEFTSRFSKDVTSDHYSNTSADNESFVEGPPQPILPALTPVLKQLCGDKEDTPEGLEFEGGSDASTVSF